MSYLRDVNDDFAVRDDLAARDIEMVNLAVVAVGATMLERIEQGFHCVIEIASPTVRRMNNDTQIQ
jgi:hypothetical protein